MAVATGTCIEEAKTRLTEYLDDPMAGEIRSAHRPLDLLLATGEQQLRPDLSGGGEEDGVDSDTKFTWSVLKSARIRTADCEMFGGERIEGDFAPGGSQAAGVLVSGRAL